MSAIANHYVEAALIKPPKRGEKEFDDVISDNAQYGKVQFWDLRYASEHEPFEWYYGYEHFRATITDNIPKDWKVMLAGCGSSRMLGDMADDGYQAITGADISRVVITQLKYRYPKEDYPMIDFFQGNMTDTDLPAGSVNAIIDKALMDSLLCTQTGPVTVQQYMYEVERLLDDEGIFIAISYGNPEQRLPILEQYDLDEPHFTPWTVEVQAIMKPREYPTEELDPSDPNSMYFIYICRKSWELVAKKKVRLGLMKKKEYKALQKPAKKVNAKPAV